MSTALAKAHLPKQLTSDIDKMDDIKPRLQRTSSIDAIKKINTYICSSHTYILPAILTTWLKTGSNSFHSSAEKTIFLFRRLIFGSFLLKFLWKVLNNGPKRLDFRAVSVRIVARFNKQLLTVLDSTITIRLSFLVALVVLTVEMCLCLFYLSQSAVPLGLGFLITSGAYIVILGYKQNKFYLNKRDVKRKID